MRPQAVRHGGMNTLTDLATLSTASTDSRECIPNSLEGIRQMKNCETCDRPWPEGQKHPGMFARFPCEDLPDSEDIDALITEQARLTSFARVTFHAIFCAWHYEDDAMSGMQWESVEPLTTLGDQLCREIARYESRINRVALRLQGKGADTEQPIEEPAKRGA